MVTETHMETHTEKRESEYKQILLSRIDPPNIVKDTAHFFEICKSMYCGGWQGRPLLVVRYSDGYFEGRYQALTGSHRIAAAKHAGLRDIPCLVLDITPKYHLERKRWKPYTSLVDSDGCCVSLDDGMTVMLHDLGDDKALRLFRIEDDDSGDTGQYDGQEYLWDAENDEWDAEYSDDYEWHIEFLL